MDGIDDTEAFLFDEGREALVGIDEVLAALLGEQIEGGTNFIDGNHTFFDERMIAAKIRCTLGIESIEDGSKM